MTRTEERLSDLLHHVAPDAVTVSFDAVARRVRRRRTVLVASVSTVAVLVAAGAYAGTALRGGASRPQGVTSAPMLSVTTPATRSVGFHGIGFVLPAGWRIAKPGCVLPSHAVVEGVWTGSCPGRGSGLPVATGVTLTAVYGPRFALSWPGKRMSWQGQPAWLAELDPRTHGGVATATLTLPWLNAQVSAQAPTLAQARSLLERVSVRPVAGLAVPKQASSVFIQSLAGRDGDGQNRSATIHSATDVQRLLTDLRALTPDVPRGDACSGSWWPNTALLTVRGIDGSARTYAARFSGCDQVVAGTGSAAPSSLRLRADIERLVPNSNL